MKRLKGEIPVNSIQIGKTTLSVVTGDITEWRGDVIVNAANAGLLGGGGVDGAIHRAGGPEIMEQCREIRKLQGGCPPGHAVVTGGGKLDAKYVFHTVGPIWEGGGRGEGDTLAACYRSCLLLAEETGCRSIAFPSISTGIYGYPKPQACDTALKAVTEWLKEETNHGIERIDFICFDSESADLYARCLQQFA